MSTRNQSLVRAFALLQRATTPLSRTRAAGLVYTYAHQDLASRCEALLLCIAPTHWSTGPDLASETLIALLLQPVRARACRQTTREGILAFLRSAAYYDLLDARDVRARRTDGVIIEPLTDRMALTHSVAPADPFATECGTFWPAYTDAVRRLPAAEQHAWILVREQEMSMTQAARELGIAPSTVSRRISSAAARLRAFLAPQFGARGPHAAPVIVVQPTRPRRSR